MAKNVAHKILDAHLVAGQLQPGEEIGIIIDQVLMQDATGTMVMLEFEALKLDHIKADVAVQYIDHNLLQTDNKNADDHRFLQTACAHYGIHFSQPGNGISHQVHMERFGAPGLTMIGSDSHTPGAAGVSMLAIGAGGLDVAMALAGKPYYLPCPRVLGIQLTGTLPDWVSAKDVVLELLRRFDVKGCVGKILEYHGPGVQSLSATDRETIGNMGTELGATTSVFPSDENTLAYLRAQGRRDAWVELSADDNCTYDEELTLDLSTLEPLIACPSSPGNVVPVREVAGTKVDQSIVGSSVNSSFRDLMTTAKIVEGRHAHPDVSFHINPGSRQVLENIAAQGGLVLLLQAGAQINQPGCLGCIGMGQAPGTNQVSLRTFPRNFPGRSGTKDDRVYLCSPETAAVSAVSGVITDPREFANEMVYPRIQDPEEYIIDTSSIVFPTEALCRTEIVRGPNIKPFPSFDALPEILEGEVVIKVGNNISTDTIMPGGNQVLPLRSNIDAISKFVFYQLNPDFSKICKKTGAAIVVGGENYGQGSSREHAALAPRYLGIRAKIAKSFARIHKANLCNFGILPLTFKNPADYERLREGNTVIFPEIRSRIARGDTEIPAQTEGDKVMLFIEISSRQRQHILAGGSLNYIKQQLGN